MKFKEKTGVDLIYISTHDAVLAALHDLQEKPLTAALQMNLHGQTETE